MVSPQTRLLVPLVLAVAAAEAGRVLMMAPLGGKSQKQLFYGLADGLVERGHEVVFFNAFKPSKPVKGVREVVPEELAKVLSDENFPNVLKMNKEGMFHAGFSQFRFMFVDGPKTAIASKEVDELLKDEFDVVVMGTLSYPLYFVPYLMQKPFILLTAVSYMPLQTSTVGNPTIPSLHPLPLLPVTPEMGFFTRVKNVIAHIVMLSLGKMVFAPFCDRLVAEKFGDGVIPPALEIEKNASLVLLSSNPAVHYHQPLLPNTIQVGGMHCLKPKPLPKELTDFLGDSEFVYFSLGSVIKPQDMSLEQKAAILAALGSLPYKVLLKWDTTDRTGLPANILPSKWLPQQDILGSSKCRLFISHGGFASVLESLCHGVPLVTMPGSGDQQFNAVNAVSLGVAELLSWDELTAESLRSAMAAALSAERLAAARHRQRLMAEQPVPPRDLAVHWVEHVMRHGGAPHLRSVGAELNFFQYYSLDVLAFLLAVLLLALKLLIAMLKCCCRCVCIRRTRRVPAETKPKAKRAKRD
ncbi:UDP-glucuronosyltransferase 1A7-like [Amphibalanus amphitrite]|uniref:UDP-glucuronosyltransferase 1A7-like n=1 Tax=Amphibalanus amphitrite TaxID=1232801 RepID=UPI001C90206D|nr:UDP-glucuronosyltransferase 1A7-like [Amphibalanus amphitrite]